MKTISIGQISLSNTLPLCLIAGPCVIEGKEKTLSIAERLVSICREVNIPLIFKASFDKANRTSLSQRGITWQEAAEVFYTIKKTWGCPVLTDVHDSHQCHDVAQVVDVLQIPAFLCRQTDLIQAASDTGKVLHIKKGQFLSPDEMLKVALKAESCGAKEIILCERGTSFGYHRLINDMRGLTRMAQSGYPVIFDATHSVQQPGALGDKSGGERYFVETLARAAVAIGIAGVFLETHPCPNEAWSDGPNMVPLDSLKGLLKTLKVLDTTSKSLPYSDFSLSPFCIQEDTTLSDDRERSMPMGNF